MGLYDELDKFTGTALLQTALNAARDDVDKREGSIIYDALAPLAFLAAKLFGVLKSIAQNSDIQTAAGDFLDWTASQFGIYRNAATNALREAQALPVGVDIETGALFQTKDGLNLTWRVTDKLENGVIVLQCETAGAAGGADYGALTPTENVTGLQSVNFTNTRSAGADAESNQNFRIRFWRELQRQSYGGNFADYQAWIFSEFATQPNGALIKAASIFPAWRGGGTIKIVPFVDGDGEALAAPSTGTLEALKAYLDPEPDDGKGAGVAPVGHQVTIEAPEFLDWEITAKVTPKTGETEITEAQQDAAAADLKAAIEAEQLNSLTQSASPFPTAAAYTFEFTRAMVINAIMGDTLNPRFNDADEIMVNGEAFAAAIYQQTGENHVLPRFKSLVLSKK